MCMILDSGWTLQLRISYGLQSQAMVEGKEPQALPGLLTGPPTTAWAGTIARSVPGYTQEKKLMLFLLLYPH